MQKTCTINALRHQTKPRPPSNDLIYRYTGFSLSSLPTLFFFQTCSGIRCPGMKFAVRKLRQAK